MKQNINIFKIGLCIQKTTDMKILNMYPMSLFITVKKKLIHEHNNK